jgi:hypothetical protein
MLRYIAEVRVGSLWNGWHTVMVISAIFCVAFIVLFGRRCEDAALSATRWCHMLLYWAYAHCMICKKKMKPAILVVRCRLSTPYNWVTNATHWKWQQSTPTIEWERQLNKEAFIFGITWWQLWVNLWWQLQTIQSSDKCNSLKRLWNIDCESWVHLHLDQCCALDAAEWMTTHLK